MFEPAENKPFMHPVKPIDELVIKVSSLCNLNCSYCYMYNLTPGSLEFWRAQPRFISPEILRAFAHKAREYFEVRDVKTPRIVLHGGEPLLAGPERFEEWFGIIGEAFAGSHIKLHMGVQTNGVLFNKEYGELFRRWGVHLGVSVDGAPGKHDHQRTDHRGRPSGELVDRALRLIASEYRDIFSGLLAVIDLKHAPQEVIDYLLSWDPPSVDLLLPLHTFDRMPNQKRQNLDDTSYGAWLVAAGERLVETKSHTPVRCLSNLFERLAAEQNNGLLFGDSWDVVSLRPDGEIEILDTFAASDPSLRSLSLTIQKQSLFDAEAALTSIASTVNAMLRTPQDCQSCQYLSVCGGCIYHSRHSKTKNFQNRSLYCSDMKHLIEWGRSLCLNQSHGMTPEVGDSTSPGIQ